MRTRAVEGRRGARGRRKGAASCIDCDAGKSSARAAVTCSPCDVGQFQSLPGMPACENCTKGKANGGTGSTECADCTSGYFGPHVGMSACLKCSSETVDYPYGPRYTSSEGSSTCDLVSVVCNIN